VFSQTFDPFTIGPYEVNRKTYYPFFDPELDYVLDVWVPDAEEAPLTTPIVYMIGGLGGLMPGAGYETIFNRVASHGFTIIQPWVLGGNPVDNYEGLWLDEVMKWSEEHLMNHFMNDGIAGGLTLDHRTLFLASHSAGGHVTADYLKHHCNDVKGQLMLSPVDGFDPFGLIDLYAITPGEYLNFAVPTLILAAGLDNTPGIDGLGGLVPPCGPTDLANMRFYDAMPGNTWLINATEYGHGDGMNQFFVDAIEFIHFCASAPDAVDRPIYRVFLSGEMVAFMKYVLGQEDCDIAQYLEDPSKMPISATAIHKASVVSSSSACAKVECEWQENPYPNN